MTDSGLDEMICFSLYTAAHATTQAYRALLKPWGLTYPQYLVLLVLAADGESTVSAIGAQMHLDSGTLSPLLRRLEARSLVTRRRDDADDRVVRVTITDAGRETTAEVRDAVACLAPAYRVSAASVPDVLATLHGITAGMGDLVESTR